jgi:hypothetical protein
VAARACVPKGGAAAGRYRRVLHLPRDDSELPKGNAYGPVGETHVPPSLGSSSDCLYGPTAFPATSVTHLLLHPYQRRRGRRLHTNVERNADDESAVCRLVLSYPYFFLRDVLTVVGAASATHLVFPPFSFSFSHVGSPHPLDWRLCRCRKGKKGREERGRRRRRRRRWGRRWGRRRFRNFPGNKAAIPDTSDGFSIPSSLFLEFPSLFSRWSSRRPSSPETGSRAFFLRRGKSIR